MIPGPQQELESCDRDFTDEWADTHRAGEKSRNFGRLRPANGPGIR